MLAPPPPSHRTPPKCPRHPLHSISELGCPLCAREHDDIGAPPAIGSADDEPLRVEVPAPVVPALGRVVATAEHVHVAPPRFPADVPSVMHCLHDVRPEQCPRCAPAPATPLRPWSDIDAHHRDSIVGMLERAAATQHATARVMRAGHLATPERITDTETRGEAYAAAVERLRDLDDESTIAGLRRALIAASTEIERLEAIEMPVDAEQAFERGWDARADATLRGAGRHVVTIREALAHELLRGNIATFAATYDRDAEAYDERAEACGTGPDHDRHRGNAERSRAAARLYRAVLALSLVTHADIVRANEPAREGE